MLQKLSVRLNHLAISKTCTVVSLSRVRSIIIKEGSFFSRGLYMRARRRENFPCWSHPIYHRHPEITCPAEFLDDREHVKGVKLRIPELCSRLSTDSRRGQGLTLTEGRHASFPPWNRRPRAAATPLRLRKLPRERICLAFENKAIPLVT